MKTTFEIIAVVAAIAAVSVSCSMNELEVENIKNTPKVTIKVNAAQSVLTRTAVDATNAVTWSAGDAIGIFQSVDDVKGTVKVTSTGLAAASDKASFSATFDAADGTEFKYVAAYPASALKYTNDTTFVAFGEEYPYDANTVVDDSTFLQGKRTEMFHRRYVLTIPTDQRPTETSWDPAADVLVSKVVTSSTQPGELNMEFHRLGTAVKMTIAGIPAGKTVKYVDFYTTEAKVCGRSHLNPLTGTIYEKGYCCYGSKIHLVPATTRTTTGDDVFWFRTLSGKLSEDFSVVVVTDNGYYTKTVDLKTSGRSLEFEEEGLTVFTVSDLAAHTAPADISLTGCIVTTSHPSYKEGTVYSNEGLVDGTDAKKFGMVRPGKESNTVDGKTTKVSKTESVWFQLDLQAPQKVSYFRIMYRPISAGEKLRLRAFDEILGSNDGSTWNVVAKDVNIVGITGGQTSPNNPIPASEYRYYRFVTSNQRCFYKGQYISDGNTYQMCEFYLGD